MEQIKTLKLKVTAQYQDEQIRVSGKSRDDLQKVIDLAARSSSSCRCSS